MSLHSGRCTVKKTLASADELNLNNLDSIIHIFFKTGIVLATSRAKVTMFRKIREIQPNSNQILINLIFDKLFTNFTKKGIEI